MSDPQSELLDMLAELLDASLLCSYLLAPGPVRGTTRGSVADRERVRSQIDALTARIRTLANSASLDMESRTLMVSLVSLLTNLSKEYVPTKTSEGIFRHYRDTIGQIALVAGIDPVPTLKELPGSAATHVKKLIGAPMREPTGPLAGKGDEIERRYRAGESMPRIARDFGVKKQAVQQLLHRRGVGFDDRRTVIDARINELASQGMTVQAIAAETGITAQTVRSTLLRLGATPLREAPKLHRMPDETAAQILRMRLAGATIREIADETSLSRSGVSQFLIRSGHRSQSRRPHSESLTPDDTATR